MRTKITSNLSPIITTKNTLSTPAAARSSWHSQVPYLFESLAAMLGLVAFALLHWKKRGRGNEGDIQSSDERPEESKEGCGDHGRR